MAIHSSILTWKIPRTEEPARLYSIGLQRVRNEWRDLGWSKRMWLPKLGYKRHCSFLLFSFKPLLMEGRKLPCLEDTQAALQRGPHSEELRPRPKLVFCGFFLPHPMACGISVPRPGIKPRPLAVKVQRLNHWTIRESPRSKVLTQVQARLWAITEPPESHLPYKSCELMLLRYTVF